MAKSVSYFVALLLAVCELSARGEGSCAAGWTADNQTQWCYVVKSTSVSWVEARQWCVSQGGDLASIHSLAEQTVLKGLVQSSSGLLWIGLHDRQDEGQFVWVDGYNLTYRNWFAGEPNNDFDEDCAVIGSDGFWRDIQCNLVNGYVCKKSYDTPLPSEDDLENFTLRTNLTLCGNGWYSYGGFCYRYFTNEVSWMSARSFCFVKGGYLLDILTPAELSYIKNFMKTKKMRSVHIGLNDRLVEGVYVWDDGTLQGHRLANNTKHWGTGEPNDNNHHEDCTEMQSPPALVWNDIPCTVLRPFICKRTQSPNGTWSAVTPVQRTSCPEGYTSFKNTATGGVYCYIVKGLGRIYYQMTWSFAQADCQQSGGDLVSIHDHTEMNAITSYIKKVGKDTFASYWEHVWIGLNDLKQAHYYRWSDGTGLSFTNWDSDEPASSSLTAGVNCAQMKGMMIFSSSLWAMENCFRRQAYVCQLTLMSPHVPHQQKQITDKYCFNGWRQYGSYCYLFKLSSVDRVNQSQAQGACKSLGGDLASIHSTAENYFILAELGTLNATGHVFIGLHDKKINGEYHWTDGSAVVYTAWAHGQPNDLNGHQDCTHLHFLGGHWNDVNCARKEGYVCKKERDQSTPSKEGKSTKCLSHWRWSNNFCYKVFQKNNSFDGARAACGVYTNNKQLHGSLAAVRNRYDNYLLVSLIEELASDKKDNYWLGLHDISGEFRWTNDAPVTFVRWAPGQPNVESGIQNCVAFQVKTAQWIVQKCTNIAHYVCMVPAYDQTVQPPQLPQPTGNPALPCPGGWLEDTTRGRCYGFFGSITTMSMSMQSPYIKPVNWLAAKFLCRRMGADLASIHDNETQSLLLNMAESLGSSWLSFWIGLNQLGAQKGSYSWTDGTPLDFTYWAVREPNDKGGTQDCVLMGDFRKGHHYRWNDRPCRDRRPFVCSALTGHTLNGSQVTPSIPAGYSRADCPKGWHSSDTSCFWLSTSEGNKTSFWSHAKLKCRALILRKALAVPTGVTADLALIRTPQDHIVIAEAIRMSNVTKYHWIGLNDRDKENQFVWTDNSSSSYRPWASGEPNDNGGQDCVAIQPKVGYLFNDRPCHRLYPYVCSFSRIVTNLTPTARPPTNRTEFICAPGWLLFQSSCYKVFKDVRLTWHDAVTSCTVKGGDNDGDLVVVNSKEEHYFIASKLQLSSMYYWIGFSDEDGEDVWRWVDGSPTTFTGWANDQPNNYIDEDCAAIDGKLTTWFDRQCDAVYPYICEIPANLTTLPPPTTGTLPSPITKASGGKKSSNLPLTIGLTVGLALVISSIVIAVGFIWLRRRFNLGSGRVQFQRVKNDDDDDDDDDLLLHDA